MVRISWKGEIMNEYGLRDDTMAAVMDAVYTLANNYINPIGDSNEPISLSDAVQYCYREFENIIQQVYGFSKACRFDGKQKIIRAIECEIQDCEDIVLTWR